MPIIEVPTLQLSQTVLPPIPLYVQVESSALFHEYARHYLSNTGPVRYFCTCRAIELELKAKHLDNGKYPEDVRKQYGHNLEKSYDALPKPQRTLDAAEYNELVLASMIYDKKDEETKKWGRASRTARSKMPPRDWRLLT